MARTRHQNLQALKARNQQRAAARKPTTTTKADLMKLSNEQLADLANFNGYMAMQQQEQAIQALQANQQLAQAHQMLQADRDAYKANVDTLAKEKGDMQARIDELEAELNAARAELSGAVAQATLPLADNEEESVRIFVLPSEVLKPGPVYADGVRDPDDLQF